MKKIILLLSILLAFELCSCNIQESLEDVKQNVEDFSKSHSKEETIAEALCIAYCGLGDEIDGIFSPASVKIDTIEITNISDTYKLNTIELYNKIDELYYNEKSDNKSSEFCNVAIKASTRLNNETSVVTKNIRLTIEEGFISVDTYAYQGYYIDLDEFYINSSDSFQTDIEGLEHDMDLGIYSIISPKSKLDKNKISEMLKSKINEKYDSIKEKISKYE